MTPKHLSIILLTLLACGDDDGGQPDAAVDAAIDTQPGPCGGDLAFTGEYVDLDSTSSSFMGVFNATWTVRNEPTRTDATSPNGRMELCIRPDAPSILDVTQTEYTPALFVAAPAVFSTPQATFSSKGIKLSRRQAFYVELLGAGATFDDTRAHVLVHKQGSPIPLTLSSAGSSFAVDNADDVTWTAGNSGGFVLFPNVPIAAAQATLSSTSSFVGPTSVPLEAGKLTITTIR